MKAKELAELLMRHPDVEVSMRYIEEFQDVTAKLVSVVYEDDGLRGPRILLMTEGSDKSYDEDYEHGFKLIH